MKRLLLLILVQMALGVAHAQTISAHWIAHPVPDSLAHVWFRQNYLCNGRPLRATVNVASTGLFKLYVNGFIVGTATYYPLRDSDDHTPKAMTFDVTRYMRNDTNTIALLYSPTCPSVERRQVAVEFYGTNADGEPFSHYSDGNWLCRNANSRLNTNGAETIDGRTYTPSWNMATFDPALWRSASEREEHELMVAQRQFYAATKTVHSRSYYYKDSQNDSVSYEFGQGFVGGIYITLRDAKRGEYINIGGMEYICTGELDEQAFPRFPRRHLRNVTVWGDRRFRTTQIFDVMTIETATRRVHDFYE